MIGRIALHFFAVLALLVPFSGAIGVSAKESVSQGDVRAWGTNGLGQLGTSAVMGSSIPRAVAGVEAVTSVAAGGSHSLALLADGTVQSWG